MATQKLRAILRLVFPSRDRHSYVHDPVEILKVDYHDQLRLAGQIQAHAEKAPYPHVAQRLRQIAREKRQHADLLKEKILSLGGRLDEPSLELRPGKNHWQRMTRDLEDQRELETRFREQATRWLEAAPEISELLEGIAAAEALHKETLLDLIARADPQAEQC